MLINAPKGKDLVAKFRALKVGDSIAYTSPLKGMDAEPTQVFLREVQGDYWTFDLRWMGILFAEVTAQIVENEIIFEEL